MIGRRPASSVVRTLSCTLSLTFALAAGPSQADDKEPRPGPLPAAAAVVPGIAVHGAGVWAAGDRDTATRLLAAEGIGLGLMTAGAFGLIVTDASGQNLDFTTALIVSGAGLFLTSGVADLYGATVGERPGARAPARVPMIEPNAGYAYVYDRQFRYRNFAVMRLDARLGRVRLSQELWQGMDDDNQRLGIEAAYRILGPTPDRSASNGSFFDVQTGFTHHRYGSDGFAILTPELLVVTRLDLKLIGRSLAGSFVDFDLGWALQVFDYQMAGRGMGTDINGLLLARFGYGLYFGGSTYPRGEAQIYYNHRHDGFAGGLAVSLHEPNLLGSVGASGTLRFSSGWGANLDLQAGSAYLARMGLIYAWGGAF